MGNIQSNLAAHLAWESMHNFPNNECENNNEIRIDKKNNENECKPFSNKNNKSLSEDDIIYSVKSQINEDNLYNKSNKFSLQFDIDKINLNNLEKESLLEIINFIKDYCEIRTNIDCIYFDLNRFRIERNNKNEYFIKIKNQKINNLKDKIGIKKN